MPTTAQPPQPGAGLALNADGVTFDINPADSTIDVTSGLKVGTITDTNVAAANKDGVAGVVSLRTLGTGAVQAAPGSGTGAGAKQGDHFVTTEADADLTASTVIPGLAGSTDVKGVGGAGTSEEYDTATTGLTWNNTPTTVDSNTTLKSHLYILNQADTTERIGTKAWVPGAGAFDVICRMTMGLKWVNAAAGPLGLHIGDAGNLNRLLLQIAPQGPTNVFATQAYTYASGAYTQRGTPLNTSTLSELYLKISRDGSNNITYWAGLTGKVWQLIATQPFTLTVANIGFRMNGSTSGSLEGAIDFLRTSV